MAVSDVLSQVSAQTYTYAPQVLAGIAAVESAVEKSGTDLPGPIKKQIVVTSIVAAAHVGEASPNSHVAEVSAMVDLFVSILKSAGVFKPKAK